LYEYENAGGSQRKRKDKNKKAVQKEWWGTTRDAAKKRGRSEWQ
jgi:hypothetical protein